MKPSAPPNFPHSIQKNPELCQDLQHLFSELGFDDVYDEIQSQWKIACNGDLVPLQEAVQNRVHALLNTKKEDPSFHPDFFEHPFSFEDPVFPTQKKTPLSEKYQFLAQKDPSPETAYLFFLSALEINPFHFPLFLDIIHFLEKNHSLSSEEVFDTYHDLLSLNEHDKDSLFILCRSFFDFQKEYRYALQEHPSFLLEELFSRFETLYSQFLSHAYSAAQSFDFPFSEDEEHSLLNFADFCFDVEDFDSAFSFYKKILFSFPNHIEATRGLAEIYLHHDIPSEALSFYREILRISPNDSDAKKKIRYIEKNASSLFTKQ